MGLIILDWEESPGVWSYNVMAMSVLLDYGVPLGSVLGSVLFLLYTSDLVELVRSFGLLIHAYADDLQVYIVTLILVRSRLCWVHQHLRTTIKDKCMVPALQLTKQYSPLHSQHSHSSKSSTLPWLHNHVLWCEAWLVERIRLACGHQYLAFISVNTSRDNNPNWQLPCPLTHLKTKFHLKAPFLSAPYFSVRRINQEN